MPFTQNLIAVMPEAVILASAMVILIVDLFIAEERRHVTYWLTQLALLVAACVTLNTMQLDIVKAFHNMIVDDMLADILRLTTFVAVSVNVMLAPGINGLFDRSPHHQYAPAAAALQVLGAGIFLMFTTNAFIAALNAMNRQVLFTWAAGVSLVVNVALNIVLIPAYGYLGAAWATNLTELALLVTGWLMVRRVLGAVLRSV